MRAILTFFILVLMVACAGEAPAPTLAPLPTYTPYPTFTPYPTPTPEPPATSTPTPTEMPTPTATPTSVPTPTPAPTNTPQPTDTPVPPTPLPTQTMIPIPTAITIPPTPTATAVPPTATLQPTPTPYPLTFLHRINEARTTTVLGLHPGTTRTFFWDDELPFILVGCRVGASQTFSHDGKFNRSSWLAIVDGFFFTEKGKCYEMAVVYTETTEYCFVTTPGDVSACEHSDMWIQATPKFALVDSEAYRLVPRGVWLEKYKDLGKKEED